LASFNFGFTFCSSNPDLNTETLAMNSHSKRRADKRNLTVTETNYADHNGNTQNGEQWRKIRVQESCRRKKKAGY